CWQEKKREFSRSLKTSRLFMRGPHAVSARPPEAILRAAARAIFGANPAAKAELIHDFEYGRVIDLPLVWLMTRRHCRTLQMADDWQEFFETMDQVAADNLHVIKIELHADIRLADLCNYVRRVLDMVEKVVWPVPTVNRFNEQSDVPCRCAICRAGKIF